MANNMKKNTGKVLVLKSVKANMASEHDSNFIYPERGMVKAEDWLPTKNCGNGLHGCCGGPGTFH